MVNRNLIRSLEDDSITSQVDLLLSEDDLDEMILPTLEELNQQFDVNQIVDGKIVEVNGEYVVIDVGFKSEGAININEWEGDAEQPIIGQTVKVLIEEMEDSLGPANDIHGMISLSKRKAEKILEWEKMMSQVKEGQVVTGTVTGRSRVVCWWISVSTSSCLLAKWIFAAPTISPTTSDALYSAKFSRLTKLDATSSLAAVP